MSIEIILGSSDLVPTGVSIHWWGSYPMSKREKEEKEGK